MKRPTKYYVVALSVVGLGATANWCLTEYSLYGQRQNAHLINQAGHQRMLSQRIALLAPKGGPSFEEATHLMREANERLLDPAKSPAKDLIGKQALLELQPLRKRVSAFIESAERGSVDASDATPLLGELNSFVLQIEKAAQNELERLARVETGLLLTTLMTLLLEALFLFRPMVNRLSRAFLEISSERDRASNSEAMMALMVENLDEGVLLTDQEGKIIKLGSPILKRWFSEAKLGNVITTLHPQFPLPNEATSETTLEIPFLTLQVRRKLVQEKDDSPTYLYFVKDKTANLDRARQVLAEVFAASQYFGDDEELYRDFRTEVFALANQIRAAPSRTQQLEGLKTLLGALAGLGFGRIVSLIKAETAKTEKYADDLLVLDFIMDEIENYIQLLDVQLAGSFTPSQNPEERAGLPA